MKTYREYLEEQLRDPVFRAEYEALEEEYQEIASKITLEAKEK